jgi:hypothetical protein
MYVILISSFLVLNVHRTTYKRINTYLVIKVYFYLTSLPLGTKYLTFVTNHKFIQINDHVPAHHKFQASLRCSIGIVTNKNYKTFSNLSNISLIAGIDVTR